MGSQGEWCEVCREVKPSAYRRPELGGRVLCSDHYYEALRKRTPTSLVRRPRFRDLPAWMRQHE